MKHLKTLVIFFIINLVVGFLVPVLFGVDAVNVLTSNGRYVYPIIIVLLGVLVGYITSLFLGKGKEKPAYVIGQLLSCVVFSLIIIAKNYNWWEYNRNYANIESNHDVMKYFVNDGESYIKTAFGELESSFGNPNDFELKSFHVDKRDTLIDQDQDTIYNVYFTYSPASEKTIKKLSKIVVFQEKVTLLYKDLDVRKETEYKNAELHSYQEDGNVEPIIDTMLKDLPQERQKTLKDTIHRLLND